MAQFFTAAPLPRKHLKFYNLRTTNAIKMNSGRIVYLHKTFDLANDLGVAQRGSEGVAQKPLKKPSKMTFLGPFPRIFKNISKPVTYVIFCHALHHWWKFCTNRIWFGLIIYEKPPKSSPKFPFFLVGETLKTFNLRTTNAMTMKLGTIVYLHETFHLTKELGVTLRA